MPDPLSQDTDQRARLKKFLDKKDWPPECLDVVAAFKVKSLGQLKGVMGDPEQRKELRKKFEDSKIRGAVQLFDNLSAADIRAEIDGSCAPEAEKRKKDFAKAIAETEKLREKVQKASDDAFTSAKTGVKEEYNQIVQRLQKDWGVQFSAATKAAAETKEELIKLLNELIKDAAQAKEILDKAEKRPPRSTDQIIRELQLLCGYYVNPDGIERKNVGLMRMPQQYVETDPGEQTSLTITYKGMQTTSVAAKSVHHTGFNLAGALEGSGAGYVGSGVLAVSVVASAAWAKQKSDAEEKFQTNTTASCGRCATFMLRRKALCFPSLSCNSAIAPRRKSRKSKPWRREIWTRGSVNLTKDSARISS